VEFVVLF